MVTMTSTFSPSKYQQAIFDFVTSGKGHGMVDAAPGSGKTTTLVEAAKLLPASCNAIFLAFNKHIATELNNRLKAQNSPMQAMTIHSLGLQALRALPVKAVIDDKKYRNLCKDYLISKQCYDYQLSQHFQKLVSMAQLTLSALDEESLWGLVTHFDIDLSRKDQEWPLIWKGVKQILDAGIEQAKKYGTVDFNDMVWLPTVLNLVPAKCDFMMIDEAQDLNRAQLELVLRSVNGTGRLLFVADKRQSLYGFAGADTQSVQNIVKRTGATVLPLSICYRCPKSHIDLCASIFTGIEARPDAPEGIIDHVKPNELELNVRPGDLVLCRTTAPLVETCLSLLRAGVRAKVRGRDIGKSFVDLIKKLQKQVPGLSIDNLSKTLEDYRQQQMVFIGLGEDADMKLAAMHDKVDTMQALLEAYCAQTLDPNMQQGWGVMAGHQVRSFDGFCTYIEGFFSDELGPVVTLSTVHKAKGLEENRVFILKPELMPFPKAKLGWQMEQELNIKYVAFSRSKSELYFVDYAKVEQEPLPEPEAEDEEVAEIVEQAEAIIRSNAGRPKIKEKLVSFKFESDTIAFLNSLPKNTKTDFIEKLIQASTDYERWQKGHHS